MSPAEPRREPTPALQHLREGVNYVWTHLPVRSMLFAVAFANLASTPATVLAPVFADRLFHQGSQGLGFMTGSLGLGAVIGTLALAHITDPARLTAIAFWSGIATGAALIVFAVSPVFPLTLAAAAALGFNIFRQLAAINTLIQSKIDDEYRGRVMSLYSMTVVGMLPIGSLIAGAMAQWLGVRLTVGLGALLSFIAAVIWYCQFPLRKSA
jgi:predicted MFS family arabinose efflux permease